MPLVCALTGCSWALGLQHPGWKAAVSGGSVTARLRERGQHDMLRLQRTGQIGLPLGLLTSAAQIACLCGRRIRKRLAELSHLLPLLPAVLPPAPNYPKMPQSPSSALSGRCR